MKGWMKGKGGWKQFKINGKVIRLGEWERWTLKHLPDREIVLWKHIDRLELSNRQKLKYIRSIHKLAEKGLVIIDHKGPRGGTTVELTRLGKEVKKRIKEEW